MDTAQPRPEGSRGGPSSRAWLRPVVTISLVGLAMFLLYVGVQSQGEVEEPVRRTGLVLVFPEPNSVALRQAAVGAEIGFEYSGRLAIDRRDIPDDQLERIDVGRNRISFVPGEGKEIASLAEGRHCASLTYWRTDLGPESAGRPYIWCFTAA